MNRRVWGGVKLFGRGDVLSGTLVIEYKTYGLLDSEAEYKKALRQVLEKYLNPINKSIAEKFHAVLFDGKTITFFDFDNKKGNWKHSRKQFNDFVLYDWVLLISKTTKKPVSSEALKTSFSIQTQIASNAISTFYSKLSHGMKTNERVKMLFDEWVKSFSYIYGGILNDKKIKEDFEEIANLITNFRNTKIEVDSFLFCFYTYYAFIVKLYASEIASIRLGINPDSPIISLLRSKDLKGALKDIETGDFYKDFADIDNYIEGGFFSWYLDVWDIEIEEEIKTILHELNKYDFESTLSDEPNSRDTLKSLYQEIIPQKIRHDLGEYYTPDWLIESILDDVGYNGKSDARLLDAGCGSGGFIVSAINRIKQESKNEDQEAVLAKITKNVVGFDVNPVSVLTARTNYLLSITPFLKNKKKSIPITLPIYLADSIITPTTEGQGKLYSDVYWISTVEGVFSLPKNFVDSGYLNDGIRIIEDCVENEYPASDFEKLFKKQIPVLEQDMKIISDFYGRLRELHPKKNKIWAKIIQNYFAPLLHSEFDFVVGNPPWIKWDFLSKEYKLKLGNLYLNIYKLFSHKGMKAGMGYSHDDISVVFMYVAIDKYLKIGGKLGFVMKQTLYKSIAGSEFRKFKIEKEQEASIPLKVLKVNDMLALAPFKSSAQSETSTIILEKGKETTYPVEYNIWIPKNYSPDEGDMLESVLSNVKIERKKAYPHNDKNPKDVWVILDSGKDKHAYISGKNYYVPRHGIVNDLNAVFFIDILGKDNRNINIQNKVGGAKKKVRPIKTTIEKDLVYPFLKPRNIDRWRMDGYSYCLVPQKKTGEKNESKIRTDHPLTFAYLHKFKDNLLNRSSRWFKVKGFPFYSIFGIGDYSFSPYKVVWSCMSYSPNFAVVSNVEDEYIGKKTVMPDNTIGSISVSN